MTEKEWLNDSELPLSIYNKKYRNGEESFDEFLERVSGGNTEVKELIRQKKFIFGGRILAGRGLKEAKKTLSNCYVLPAPQDNLESIMECCAQLARTFSYGGGAGIDISNLRPNGAITHNASKVSSGPVSFMDVYSTITNTISQQGRRGALMISMSVNHPDIEEFIDCKTDLERVKYANISVRMNNEFMQAVKANKDYILRYPITTDISIFHEEPEYPLDKEALQSSLEYNKLKVLTLNGKDIYVKKVRAKELFNKLVKNNWDYAEPGILYWDRVEDYNLVSNDPNFHYAGVNPCGEEPLPAGGSCLLGSLNLSEFVKNPFTKDAYFDYDSLDKATDIAIIGLNEVLLEGQPLHPLKVQQDTVGDWRQIGLGTMGLGDVFIKMGIVYGSKKSIELITNIYSIIATSSVLQSLELAKIKGAYPKCKPELVANSPFIQSLGLTDSEIEDIKKYGLYNSQLLTCAPTGSIGTMLEVSTGVEPYFAFSYKRRTVSLGGEKIFDVDSKIVSDYKKATKDDTLPSYFVSSGTINPLDRVKVQGALQKYIDAAISSTVNLPKEATVEQVSSIYMSAYEEGLKGITVFRDGCKRLGILTTNKPEEGLPKRPKVLEADLYSIKVKGEQFIILIGLKENKPYELFAFKPNLQIALEPQKGTITKFKVNKEKHYIFKSDTLEIKNLEALNDNLEERASTLYVSALLRYGAEIVKIIKLIGKVSDNIASFSAAISRVLSKYITTTESSEKCPECGGDIINEGGCLHCKNCGWSKCG